MAYDVVRPLIHEVLTKVNNAKVKDKKIEVLRKYQSDGLKMILKSSFDPKIVWRLPDGDVPFIKNDAPAGTEHTRLEQEASKLFHFIKGGNDKLKQVKCETMFVQMLEGLQEGEAEVLILAKDKRLHQKYKGLSKQVVQEAFDWDDNFLNASCTTCFDNPLHQKYKGLSKQVVQEAFDWDDNFLNVKHKDYKKSA